MCNLLEKEVKLNFDDHSMQAFKLLKKRLIKAPILIAPNWDLPFKLMCYASDTVVGATLETVLHSKCGVGHDTIVYL